MKLLYQIAQQNDYEGFKKALKDELGKKAYIKLEDWLKMAFSKDRSAYEIREQEVEAEELFYRLIDYACKTFALEKDLLLTKLNKRQYVYTRNSIVVIIMEQYPKVRASYLGALFGRDHSWLNTCPKRHKNLVGYSDYDVIYQTLRNHV